MPFSLLIVALVLLQTWVLQPVAGQRWAPVVAVVVIAAGVAHARRSGDWGWSSRALWPGLALAAGYTAACAAGLFLIAQASGQRGRLDFDVRTVGWLLLWGGAQQWLLQTTFLREALRVGAGRGWIIAPLLFGALHLPNPFLTLATTLAAFGWCAIYRRHPNVLPLAVSHAIGTLVASSLFDAVTTGRLRVGYSYLALP